MKKHILLATIFVTVFLVSLVSAGAASYTEKYHPTSGVESFSPTVKYVFNPTDLASINASDASDGIFYLGPGSIAPYNGTLYSSGNWLTNYNSSRYIEFSFTPSIPRNAKIENTVVRFEWRRALWSDKAAKLLIWDETAGSWVSYEIVNLQQAGHDDTEEINVYSYINTVEDVNNIKIRFQATDGGVSYTGHDLVEFEVTYSYDDEEPDTNITYITQYNETYNPFVCDPFTHFVIVPYKELIAHGVSSDVGRGNSPIAGIMYRWDSRASKSAQCNDTSCNNGDLTEYWWTDYNDYNPPFSDGLHTICGWAKDNAGNLEPVDSNDDCCYVCVDTTPPSKPRKPELQNPSGCVPNYIAEDPVFAWAESTDTPECSGVAYYEVEVYYSNGTLYLHYNESDTTTTFRGNNGEDYYIRVRAWDKAGNAGEWSEYSEKVYVDTEKPKVTITSPTQGTWFNNDFEVNETDEDENLWKCYYRIVNNGKDTLSWTETTCNEPITINISKYCPEDGTCTVHKKAIDKACNEDKAYKWFKIDRTPPTTTKKVYGPKVEGKGEIDYYINSTTNIELNCTDEGIGCNLTCYEVYNATGSLVASECKKAPYNITITGPDGNYTIKYWSNDSLGNTEAVKEEKDYLDNTGPTIDKAVYDPKYPYNNGYYVTDHTNFSFTCNDGDGVDNSTVTIILSNSTGNYVYVIKEGENITFNSEDGEFNLTYYCTDALGNKGEERNESDYMDNTPPEVEILNPDSPVGCAMLTFDVIAYVEDDGSGVREVYARMLNGSGKVTYNWTLMQYIDNNKWRVAFSNLIDAGRYSIEVKAIDNVENENIESKQAGFYEDVYFATYPEKCTVNWQEGGNCSFEYEITLCHGGDMVTMVMHELCCTTFLNPTLSNSTDTVFVGQLIKIPFFWYGFDVYAEQLTGWCSGDDSTEWGDFIKLRNWNETTRTGYITLNLKIPKLQSCGMCDKVYYAINYAHSDGTSSIFGFPRVSYFGVECKENKLTLDPKGPTFALCGNGIKEGSEECDGSDFGGLTCSDFGFTGGSLSCTTECKIDTSGCYYVGTGGTGGAGGAGGAGTGGGAGGGGASTGGAARKTTTHTVSVCGNGICEAGEDEICPVDCMVSGNEQEKSSEEKVTEAGEGEKESEKELEKASTDVSTSTAMTGAFINITKEQGIGMLAAAIAIIATLIVLLRKKLF